MRETNTRDETAEMTTPTSSSDNGGDQSPSVNRRNFVRGLGVAGGLATGVTAIGPAGAKETSLSKDDIEKAKEVVEARRALGRTYDDPEQVRHAIEANSAELLQELSSSGYIQRPSLSELPLESTLDQDAVSPTEREEGVAVTITSTNNTLTAMIMVSLNTASAAIGIYLQPETGTHYALVRDNDTGEMIPVGNVDEAVTPSSDLSGSKTEGSVGTDEVQPTDACSEDVRCRMCGTCACHIDESPYCTHVWYTREVYRCCTGIDGCFKVGEKPCSTDSHDGCHNHEGPLCCCV